MTTIDSETTQRTSVDGVMDDHVRAHLEAMDALQDHLPTLKRWGEVLAHRLMSGHRLLAGGNGGSAAEAQHLTAELVGRFDGERRAFSAISLHAESSSVTAIGNDYGFDQIFARQITAHARAGDIVVLLSTSGRSPNLTAAVEAAKRAGAVTWAFTGTAPNPLSLACDDHIALPGPGAAVQEGHLVALHLLCRVFDECVRTSDAATDGSPE